MIFLVRAFCSYQASKVSTIQVRIAIEQKTYRIRVETDWIRLSRAHQDKIIGNTEIESLLRPSGILQTPLFIFEEGTGLALSQDRGDRIAHIRNLPYAPIVCNRLVAIRNFICTCDSSPFFEEDYAKGEVVPMLSHSHQSTNIIRGKFSLSQGSLYTIKAKTWNFKMSQQSLKNYYCLKISPEVDGLGAPGY